MANEDAVAKPRTWPRKLGRVLWLGAISVVVILFFGGLAWRYSGSNQWELVDERNGVKVYSLKSPGSDLTQVKGVVRVRSTLGGLVQFMGDADVCDDYGCYDVKTIDAWDEKLQYGSFRVNFPRPFKPREFVIRTQVHQNPKTKEVVLEYAAAPEKAPLDDCCFRVTNMNNSWRFKPVGNGIVEAEYHMNMNEGGFIPAVMLNRVRPKVVYRVLATLQKLLDKHAPHLPKADFIAEE